jgi:hypothetical protein
MQQPGDGSDGEHPVPEGPEVDQRLEVYTPNDEASADALRLLVDRPVAAPERQAETTRVR